MNFTPNWMLRGSCAPKIFPTVELVMFRRGSLKWAWLKALKNSARNCILSFSPSEKSFKRPMSQFWKPGPSRMLLPELPNRGRPVKFQVFGSQGFPVEESRLLSSPSNPVPITAGVSWVQVGSKVGATRSEEHTSELQSRLHLVCRLLLEKKKKQKG